MAANGGTTSPLTSLGLQPDDEVTYRLLLSRPGATVQEVAELLGLSGADTGRTLARLGSAGMLAVADGRVEPVSRKRRWGGWSPTRPGDCRARPPSSRRSARCCRR